MNPHRTTALALTGLATLFVMACSIEAADAHDFRITVTTPVCVNGEKKAEAHVYNDWTTDMTADSAFLSGSVIVVKPAAYGVIASRVNGSTVGKGVKDTVTGRWSDGVSMTHTYVIDWGSGTCTGSPTTPAPTTTTIPCKSGETWNAPVGSPGQCVTAGTTAPTEPPATNAAPTTVPVVDSTPPISMPNTPTSIARTSPPRTATAPPALPATGAGELTFWLVLAAGVMILLGVLAWIALQADRRKAVRKARAMGAGIVLDPSWPKARRRSTDA